MQVVEVTKNVRAKVSRVRGLIKEAGNQIVGVHFVKRTDGKRRRMACRFRVQKPQYASVPSGKKMKYDAKEKNLVTVFDVNCLRYNNKHRLCGRGSWKTIPMDTISRLKVNGVIHKFVS